MGTASFSRSKKLRPSLRYPHMRKLQPCWRLSKTGERVSQVRPSKAPAQKDYGTRIARRWKRLRCRP